MTIKKHDELCIYCIESLPHISICPCLDRRSLVCPAVDTRHSLANMKSFSPFNGPIWALGALLLARCGHSQDTSSGAFDVLDFVDPLIGTANGG